MGPRGYALTVRDELKVAALDAIAWHLDELARSGAWDLNGDAIHDRLGFYGLGRN